MLPKQKFSFLLHTLLVIFVVAEAAVIWLNENPERKLKLINGGFLFLSF
jgi:hypothetical protein